MASTPAPVWKVRIKAALRLFAQMVLILAVSIFVLMKRGATMCDPFFLLPFSLFSALLAGPILIDKCRQYPNRPAGMLVSGAAAQSSGAVLLILALSLALVNLAVWHGHVLIPTVETCFWTVVLSVTAAFAAGAGLLVFRSSGSMNTMKWISRALALAAVLAYRYLPIEWSSDWIGTVLDWGITPTAIALEAVLIAAAATCLYVLRRRERITAAQPPLIEIAEKTLTA
jgi:hypothetical protein